MSVQDVKAIHKALVDANRSRGDLYVQMLRALERRHGRAEAIATMKEAIRAWGCGLAAGLAGLAPHDFEGLKQRFALAPDDGVMFGPRVDRCDADGMTPRLSRGMLELTIYPMHGEDSALKSYLPALQASGSAVISSRSN